MSLLLRRTSISKLIDKLDINAKYTTKSASYQLLEFLKHKYKLLTNSDKGKLLKKYDEGHSLAGYLLHLLAKDGLLLGNQFDKFIDITIDRSILEIDKNKRPKGVQAVRVSEQGNVIQNGRLSNIIFLIEENVGLFERKNIEKLISGLEKLTKQNIELRGDAVAWKHNSYIGIIAGIIDKRPELFKKSDVTRLIHIFESADTEIKKALYDLIKEKSIYSLCDKEDLQKITNILLEILNSSTDTTTTRSIILKLTGILRKDSNYFNKDNVEKIIEILNSTTDSYIRYACIDFLKIASSDLSIFSVETQKEIIRFYFDNNLADENFLIKYNELMLYIIKKYQGGLQKLGKGKLVINRDITKFSDHDRFLNNKETEIIFNLIISTVKKDNSKYGILIDWLRVNETHLIFNRVQILELVKLSYELMKADKYSKEIGNKLIDLFDENWKRENLIGDKYSEVDEIVKFIVKNNLANRFSIKRYLEDTYGNLSTYLKTLNNKSKEDFIIFCDIYEIAFKESKNSGFLKLSEKARTKIFQIYKQKLRSDRQNTQIVEGLSKLDDETINLLSGVIEKTENNRLGKKLGNSIRQLSLFYEFDKKPSKFKALLKPFFKKVPKSIVKQTLSKSSDLDDFLVKMKDTQSKIIKDQFDTFTKKQRKKLASEDEHALISLHLNQNYQKHSEHHRETFYQGLKQYLNGKHHKFKYSEFKTLIKLYGPNGTKMKTNLTLKIVKRWIKTMKYKRRPTAVELIDAQSLISRVEAIKLSIQTKIHFKGINETKEILAELDLIYNNALTDNFKKRDSAITSLVNLKNKIGNNSPETIQIINSIIADLKIEGVSEYYLSDNFDYEDSLKLGERWGTCQSWSSKGPLNTGLVSTTNDATKKYVLIKDLKGQWLARAIIHLVMYDSEWCVLLDNNRYHQNEEQKALIQNFARYKAQNLGIKFIDSGIDIDRSKLVIFGKTGRFYSDSGLTSSEINPEKYTAENRHPQNQQII